MKKTVTVFAATGVAGSACVEELLRMQQFNVRVLLRKSGQQEKSSSGALRSGDDKQQQRNDWMARGVEVRSADVTDHSRADTGAGGHRLPGSCVPLFATESQYPLIWAAKEAGVERFVPSEFGSIYEWEQFWPTDTVHKTMSRQKAFIRRMIEMTGMDFTIIPAGLWPEYYMLEPVGVMGDGAQKFSWSSRDVTSAASFPTCWRTRPRAMRSARSPRRPIAPGTNCSTRASACWVARWRAIT